MSHESALEVLLVRHGETAWSQTGQHTGRTDIPLTPNGRREAALIGTRLVGRRFALVLTSPLARARETGALAGFATQAQLEPGLQEWDYGAYEGRTTADIRKERPGWSVFVDGAPGGEDARGVGIRADRVLARARAAAGPVLLFAHGHVGRVIGARWIGLPPDQGRLLALSTASISVLAYEREVAVLARWNDTSHLASV